MTNKQIIDKIISEYKIKYQFIPTIDVQSFALNNSGIIVLDTNRWENPNSFFLFSVLHEIGHCETYNRNQTKPTREFLATQWAIEHCKQYGIKLNSHQQKEWQDYIYSFSKAKDKSKYQLDWNPMKGE